MTQDRHIRFVVAVLSACLTAAFAWWLYDARDNPGSLQVAVASGVLLGVIRTWEAINSLRTGGRPSSRVVRIAANLLVWTAILAVVAPLMARTLAR